MKTIITGTVGLDKIPYLDKVRACAAERSREITLCHIGQRMYAEAPDVQPGRILDLPLARLHQLRRSVFKDILNLARNEENLIINTHATFRWRHGLFPAFDFDQITQLDPDMYICLIDNLDAVHARLLRDHHIDHTLKDLLVWREEEILATEMMLLGSANQRRNKPAARFFVLAKGVNDTSALMLYRLMFEPHRPRAYLGFPMTHVADQPEILAQIEEFRRALWEHFIIFDPADLEEHQLYLSAVSASQAGHRVIEQQVLGQTIRYDVAEVMQVAGDIHAQIYARDFMLIDQAQMIISFIPELPDGRPGLSSGVERELQHAHEATREVYVIWRPKVHPSPFITETATKVFPDTNAALAYFHQQGYIKNQF